jgi:hypothetical protein
MPAMTSGPLPNEQLPLDSLRANKSPRNINVDPTIRYLEGNSDIFHIAKSLTQSACQDGRVDVLKFLHRARLLRADEKALDLACLHGQTEVLSWWLSSNMTFTYSEKVITRACQRGDLALLEWFEQSGLELKCSSQAYRAAASNGGTGALEWLARNDPRPIRSDLGDLMDLASHAGSVDALNWLNENGFGDSYTEEALDLASHVGLVEVLDWWMNSNKPLKYTGNALKYACINHNIKALEWWRRSGLELKVSPVVLTVSEEDEEVRAWCIRAGIIPTDRRPLKRLGMPVEFCLELPECPICDGRSESVKLLCCSQSFCRDCFFSWSGKTMRCPFCRTERPNWQALVLKEGLD